MTDSFVVLSSAYFFFALLAGASGATEMEVLTQVRLLPFFSSVRAAN
jgi:hypothetical protein